MCSEHMFYGRQLNFSDYHGRFAEQMFGDVRFSKIGEEIQVVLTSSRRRKEMRPGTPLIIIVDTDENIRSIMVTWAELENEPGQSRHSLELLLEACGMCAIEPTLSPVLRRMPDVPELALAGL